MLQNCYIKGVVFEVILFFEFRREREDEEIF